MSSFEQLGLDQWLISRLETSLSITCPTSVQSASIPVILCEDNVIVQSPTGSGKSLGFILPILHSLSRRSPPPVHALILTPVRELAMQIASVIESVAAEYSVLVVTGGRSSVAQARLLGQRPNIVVATPGRLADLLVSGGVHSDATSDLIRAFKQVKYFVLDEADKLLNPGFEEALGVIMKVLPSRKERQTLLFSATLTRSIEALKEAFCSTAMKLITIPPTEAPSTITHKYVLIPPAVKLVYLIEVLEQLIRRASDQAIVFTSSIRSAQLLATVLNKLYKLRKDSRQDDAMEATRMAALGLSRRKPGKVIAKKDIRLEDNIALKAVTLHSLLPTQKHRTAALNSFRNHRSNVLVTTDVAARGLDIPNVPYVIQFDLPREIDQYVHRAGRCGRAGRRGTSISLVGPSEVTLLGEVEKLVQMAEVEEELSLEGAMEAKVTKRMTAISKLRQEAELIMEDLGFDEKLKERKLRQ